MPARCLACRLERRWRSTGSGRQTRALYIVALLLLRAMRSVSVVAESDDEDEEIYEKRYEISRYWQANRRILAGTS